MRSVQESNRSENAACLCTCVYVRIIPCISEHIRSSSPEGPVSIHKQVAVVLDEELVVHVVVRRCAETNPSEHRLQHLYRRAFTLTCLRKRGWCAVKQEGERRDNV